MSKNILLVVTNHSSLGATGKTTGYDLLQVTHPLYEFENAGFDTTIISPQGGSAPMDENSRDISDPLNRNYLERASFTHRMDNTLAAGSIRPSNYQGILFVGGMGALWDFPNNAALGSLAMEIHARQGVVAAICHGTAALLGLHLSNGSDLLKGRNVTGLSNIEAEVIGLSEIFPLSLETELKRCGANYSCFQPWQRHCVRDGLIVTGQNSASARGVGEAVVQILQKQN